MGGMEGNTTQNKPTYYFSSDHNIPSSQRSFQLICIFIFPPTLSWRLRAGYSLTKSQPHYNNLMILFLSWFPPYFKMAYKHFGCCWLLLEVLSWPRKLTLLVNLLFLDKVLDWFFFCRDITYYLSIPRLKTLQSTWPEWNSYTVDFRKVYNIPCNIFIELFKVFLKETQ